MARKWSRAVTITAVAASAVIAILSSRCAPGIGNGVHNSDSPAQANMATAAQATGEAASARNRDPTPATGSSEAATSSSATPTGNRTNIARDDSVAALGVATASAA